MSNLYGKVAVVTGAGQGQGRTVAKRLAKDGAAVIVTDIIRETAEATAEQITEEGGKTIAFVADLGEYKQAEAMIALALSQFGQLDILCNVAGVGPGGNMASPGKKFWETTPEEWERDVRNNLYTCLNCCKAALGHMMERRSGKIVNWDSAAILVGLGVGMTVYRATKGAIYTLTKCLARELGQHNITVNSIAPGIIVADPDTRPPMAHLSPEQQKAWMSERVKTVPLGRVGTGEDIASVAAFLVSDEASWITGQSICVSGGETVR
ncbi:SDR family NAD(P)-dependent oxidoreductase [Chloroflexota bacterium]